MPKFRVEVLAHLNLDIEVEAENEDTATDVAEAQVRQAHPDAVLIEAINWSSIA